MEKNFNSLEDCKRHLEQFFAQKDKKFQKMELRSCLENGRKQQNKTVTTSFNKVLAGNEKDVLYFYLKTKGIFFGQPNITGEKILLNYMYYYYVFAHLLLKFDHSFPLWYKKSKPKVQGDLIVLYLLSELGPFRSVLGPMNYSKRLWGQNYIRSYKFSTRTALANNTGIQLATARTSIVSTWKPRPNASKCTFNL